MTAGRSEAWESLFQVLHGEGSEVMSQPGGAESEEDYAAMVAFTDTIHDEWAATPDKNPLLPAENIALTMALAQIDRDPTLAALTPNIAFVCVMALARLAGRRDWTKEDDDG